MGVKVRFSFLVIFGGLSQLLSGCHSMPTYHEAKDALEIITFEEAPAVERTGLRLGGFSGLVFEGFNRLSGEYDFTTHTGAGPILDLRKDSGEKNLRPFVDATFAPRWVTFNYDSKKRKVGHIDEVILMKQDGKPMTGLPNVAGVDETPIDELGHRVTLDRSGIDPQGLAKDPDGSYWMCEEYRPSVLHFSSSGRLLKRWIPKDSAAGTGVPQLPNWYTRRQLNRGFDGIALDGDRAVVFLKSPLKNDDDVTRILAVDKATGQPQAEYAYAFENTDEGRSFVDKIGDAVNIGPGRFLVIEQNNAVDDRGFHRVYEIDTTEATDTLSRNGGELYPLAQISQI